MSKIKKSPLLFKLLEFIFITIGAVIAAFSLEAILVPNSILDGGVTGISIIFNILFEWKLGLCIFLINSYFSIKCIIHAYKAGIETDYKFHFWFYRISYSWGIWKFYRYFNLDKCIHSFNNCIFRYIWVITYNLIKFIFILGKNKNVRRGIRTLLSW